MNLDRVKERLRKLLRLARESNAVGEAASAAAQAQAMLSKYQIAEAELEDLDARTPIHTAFGDEGLYSGKRIPFWVLRLAANVAALNNCEACIQTFPHKRVIGVVGVRANVDLVSYLFRYLKREIERLCAHHARPTGQKARGTKWRNSFKLGAADEVILRMREARDQTFRGATSTALARIHHDHLAALGWMDEHKDRVQPKPKEREPHFGGYVTGRVVGKDIELEADVALPEPPKQLETSCG